MIAVVNDAGQQQLLRKGAELPEFVSKDKIRDLVDAGLVEKTRSRSSNTPTGGDAEGKPAVDVTPDAMTLAQLKVYATEHGIDLGKATKVDDVRAVVLAAGAQTDASSPATGSDSGDSQAD
ncbi:hypothetical protein G9U51_08310 [Calidifontibacter sp. DB0510]|uniref:Uncharacterized protein n=1 Tax=Metallococcus carri TaxID=1656884 RepID=A0A967AZY4_9MICO|nr:hypothetical protein [Metallococcus carri]NHN55778.1 hypothetical protein [Metallococcus carri]NOP38533.1 hypothetical protein [Calidifontibacter sp. DB2511S]